MRKYLVKNWYKADQIFKKSQDFLGWPLINTIFISTSPKDLKLGHCLDIEDMTSPSKFGEVMLPSSHFIGCSVFYWQAFSSILQVVL